MRNKSLKLNALLNSFQSLLNLVFPLITFPYVSRTLSVDGVGKYNFANSIVSYFLLIAALGINSYAIREGSKLRDDHEQISKFASRVFTINLGSTIFSYLLLFITLLIFPGLYIYTTAILIFSIQIIFTTLGTDWIYTIFEEYGYITARNIAFKIISIALLFIFVRNSDDYLNYVAITVFASTGSYVLNFIHARKFCDIKLDFHFNWKPYLTPMLILFASGAIIKIYVSSDTVILGLLKGDYSVGIYSVSTKVYGIVGSLLMAMMSVTIPRLSMLIGQKRMAEYNKLFKQLVNVMLIIILPGVVGLMMTSRDIVVILSGEKYLRAASSLAILAIAILGSSLSTLFTTCALYPLRREKKTLISSAVSAFVNVGLNFALIPFFSENAAAFTTALSEIIVMLMNFYYSRDVTGFVFKDKGLWHNVITVILGCGGIVVVCVFVNVVFSGSLLLRLIISVSASAIIYIVILLISRNTFALNYFNELF